jgi:hypothetical protein
LSALHWCGYSLIFFYQATSIHCNPLIESTTPLKPVFLKLSDTYITIDKGESILLVALDLSAAFDTVHHDTLLRRLEYTYGITDSALNWIKSYLSSRSQFVSISGNKSLPLTLGVPQGSVLGPLLFSTYTSPVASLVSSFRLKQQQYADDTQLYISVQNSNHNPSLTSIQTCLSALCLWYAKNGLCINPSKSESVLFSTSNRLKVLKETGLDTISVCQSAIPISSSMTTLGVNIDSTLTMSKHVKATVKACNHHIRAIKHIRHLLTTEDASSLAVSLIHSKLDYCNSLLYNTSISNAKSRQRIQSNLARLVLQPSSPTSAETLLQTLHWLPVQHRITYKIACLTHAALKTKQPAYLSDLLHPYKPNRTLRSSDKHLLTVPRTRLSLTSQSFHLAAPTIWNSLPLHLRQSTDMKHFKSALKTHLLCTTDH